MLYISITRAKHASNFEAYNEWTALVPLRFGHLCTMSVHGPRNGPRLLSPTDGSKSKTPSAERDRSSSGTATVQGNHRSTFSSDDRRRARRATARGRRCPARPPSPHTRSRLPNIRLFLYNVAFRAPCEQLHRARRRLLQEALGQACPGAESVRQTAPPRRKETSAI